MLGYPSATTQPATTSNKHHTIVGKIFNADETSDPTIVNPFVEHGCGPWIPSRNDPRGSQTGLLDPLLDRNGKMTRIFSNQN
jgi:hypothetical protein